MGRRREITEENKRAPCQQLHYYGIYRGTYNNSVAIHFYPETLYLRRDREREATRWCVGARFPIQFPRTAENRDLSFSFPSFWSFSLFANVCRSAEGGGGDMRQRKISSGVACVTGTAARAISLAAIFSPRGRGPSSFSPVAGNDKPADSESLALIQLYNESLLIKVWLTRGEDGEGGGNLVGRHGFHAFAMQMSDAGKVGNSDPIRGPRERRWLAKRAFNEITPHFAVIHARHREEISDEVKFASHWKRGTRESDEIRARYSK